MYKPTCKSVCHRTPLVRKLSGGLVVRLYTVSVLNPWNQEMQRKNLGPDRIFERGRSTLGWSRGERIYRLDQLKPGDILIAVSHQFRAENLLRVVASPSPNPNVLYCEYVRPDTLRRSDHEEMAVWDHDLTAQRTEFFRSVQVGTGIAKE